MLGDPIQSVALDILCLLIEVNCTRSRSGLLRQANPELEKLRYLVRLASDLHFLNRRRYQHAAERIDEIGRLVAGTDRPRQPLSCRAPPMSPRQNRSWTWLRS